MPHPINAELARKYDRLLAALRAQGRLAVAYSAGVDSTFLARATLEALGPDNTLAVFARCEPLSPGDEKLARRIAARHGIPLRVIDHPAFETTGFADNTPERCYVCKRAVLKRILSVAAEAGFEKVADGTGADDLRGDYRPGMRASKELGAISPLVTLEWTKSEIRAVAHHLDLENWDRPSEACLATRFPYRSRITPEGLDTVARAEAFLHERGFAQVRVRHHGPVARIEVPSSDLERWAEPSLRRDTVAALRALGFHHVALDLEGYRTGSMNADLDT